MFIVDFSFGYYLVVDNSETFIYLEKQNPQPAMIYRKWERIISISHY